MTGNVHTTGSPQRGQSARRQNPATSRISPAKGVPSGKRGSSSQRVPPVIRAATAGRSSSGKAPRGVDGFAAQRAKEVRSKGLGLWRLKTPTDYARQFRTRMAAAGEWLHANRRTPPFMVASVLVVVYVLASVLFSFLFMPGTTVNGENASWRTAGSLTREARDAVQDFEAHIEGDGMSLSLDGSNIRLAVDQEAFSAGASERLARWTWPVRLFSPRSYKVTDGVSFDRSRLRSVVSDMVADANEGATPPTDAGLSYDETAGTFVAVEEKIGTMVDDERVLATVVDAVSQLHEQVELGADELMQPTCTADGPQMAQAIEQANKLVELSIPLTINGETVGAAEGQTLRSFITLKSDGSITGDLDAITEWARGELSQKLDTVGSTRTYTRANDGKQCEVSGGTYGWCIDGASLAELVVQSIEEGSSEPVEVPMITVGDVYSKDGQDWGSRYIDVDLSEQYVRMFDESSSVIWESPCVSGDISLDNGTVLGVYAIYDKESPKKLIGHDEDGDGKPDYENDVDFWMPFYGGYGFHDAVWRWDFGGDIFQYNGSHGCVNLPYDYAQALYEIINVDDVVVVHW